MTGRSNRQLSAPYAGGVSASPAARSGAALISRADRTVRRRPGTADALLALVLLVTLGALSLSGLADLHQPAWARAVLLAALAMLHLSVVGRRQWPRVAFGAASLAMLAVVALPDAHGALGPGGRLVTVPLLVVPSCLVYAVLLTTVSARSARPEALLALGIGLLGVALAAIRVLRSGLFALSSSPWTSALVVLGLVAMVATAWLLGLLITAIAAARASDRAHAVSMARAAERAEIAREVHDIVAHSLAVIVRQAEAGSYVAQSDPDQAARALQVVADTGRDALHDMRGMLTTLRTTEPSTRDGTASESVAGTRGLAEVDDLLAAARAGGLTVEHSRTGDTEPLAAAADLAAYRVLQESLTNAIKHAGPGSRVSITQRWLPDRLELVIHDDGTGAAAARPMAGAGAGLAGLRERLLVVRGTLEAGPDQDGGFVVRAVIPSGPA